MNLCDLSYFFNKFILWIEPSHAIMKFRAFPLGLLSISGAREYYIYITNDNVTRMGPNSWLIHMIILSEWLLFFKNYDGIPRKLMFLIYRVLYCCFSHLCNNLMDHNCNPFFKLHGLPLSQGEKNKKSRMKNVYIKYIKSTNKNKIQ